MQERKKGDLSSPPKPTAAGWNNLSLFPKEKPNNPAACACL